MKKTQIIDAIDVESLNKILLQTGQYEDFISGNIKCACCGDVISLDNISTIIPYDGENGIKLKFFCNKLECVNSDKK